MRQASPRLALNHMAAPRLDVRAFFGLARSLAITDVEIRNDLGGNLIAGGMPATDVRSAAAEAGVTIISINALQRFNDWNPVREAEAIELADFAASCRAKALVLVPVNDGSGRANGERQGNLRVALKALKPILEARGLAGLVEPLGFESCSLRSKKEAADAIAAVDGQSVFRLVHDTFHHTLAGEPGLFCKLTGLVHISGVNDPTVRISDMRDPHRVLVGPQDRLDNVGQIRALLDGGYAGPFSFEPFAEEVHALDDVSGALTASIDFIRQELMRARSAAARSA